MSFFNKPKRNLRVRGITEPEDGEDALETVRMTNETKKPKAVKTKQSLLSFEEDLEGDDGEVFKVKKSAQSKKIKKQMDKERKKKKDRVSSPPDSNNEKSKTTNLDQDIVIKLKNTFPILNGREAEKADPDARSSDEDTPSSGPIHRFTKRSDLVIERGKIPDAATIHAARKQRQHVREMGEVVPLPEEPESFENSKSRLVREDDNDISDGEQERINMAVNLAHEDRMRRKAEFEAAQHIDYEESDKGEEEEWEAQQIRKGVTGAQIAAVQQETMYYQQYMGTVGVPNPPVIAGSVDMGDVLDMAPTEAAPAVFPPLPSTGNNEPQLVIAKLKDRLAEVQSVHRRHCLDRDAAFEELEALRKENDKIRDNTPWLGERFRFYQDLRGYVTDLVDCLDEKILVIKLLEQRVEELYSQKVSESVARRRQDVIDQTHELAPQRRERDENEVRRIAEREGRRIRRQRARELKGMNNHVEGMSSDEETTETEQINIRSQREVIEQDVKHVFDDVLEDFSTVEGVLRRFENWKKFDLDAYKEAYVSLCIPKVLGPLIRMQMLFWNPFSSGANDVEKSQWFHCIAQFCMEEKESETSLRNDPDVQLLPRVIEKVVLPKLTQLVSKCWDPLSSSQTVLLVGLVTKFIQDYPTVNHSSKLLSSLLKAVVEKMKEAVENDVYIPLYPRTRLAEAKLNAFFLRQCAVAMKLLSNIVRWQGIVSDNLLAEIALDALLTRYLVLAMRNSPPLQAANLCLIIGNALPRVWLQPLVHPPQLTSFFNEAKNIARQLDFDNPLEREALERMGSILKATA